MLRKQNALISPTIQEPLYLNQLHYQISLKYLLVTNMGYQDQDRGKKINYNISLKVWSQCGYFCLAQITSRQVHLAGFVL